VGRKDSGIWSDALSDDQLDVQFGKLERVSARAGWPHEASAFTPWLATHVELLGEAVGLALSLEAREHPVGRYSLDLLLSDETGRKVIVENQFGQTDHGHLGKLLTYCAGTDAEIVIWIAERLNSEYVAALEWLNDKTGAEVGFFGIEFELLRIDQSPLAPNFRVLVQPNAWTKSVRPTTATQPIDWDWAAYGAELRVPAERLAIGRRLAELVEEYASQHELPWTLQFRKGYVACLRPGGYRVAIIDLYWKSAPRFAVRLPDTPESLQIQSPYPQLRDSWDTAENMWGWTVPSHSQIPDVVVALETVRPYNPAAGPMSRVVMDTAARRTPSRR
jgi:hypothetical protein